MESLFHIWQGVESVDGWIEVARTLVETIDWAVGRTRGSMVAIAI